MDKIILSTFLAYILALYPFAYADDSKGTCEAKRAKVAWCKLTKQKPAKTGVRTQISLILKIRLDPLHRNQSK